MTPVLCCAVLAMLHVSLFSLRIMDFRSVLLNYTSIFIYFVSSFFRPQEFTKDSSVFVPDDLPEFIASNFEAVDTSSCIEFS